MGRGAAPIAARMLVKLAAAPSAFVRHSSRFLTYEITLRDLRDALYPPERLDGTSRKPPNVGRMWPRIRESVRVINQDARIPILDPKTGYGHFHHLLRVNENFGRIDLDMPIHVVLDIPLKFKAASNFRSDSTSGELRARPHTALYWACRFSGMSLAALTLQKAGAGCGRKGLTPTTHWPTTTQSPSRFPIARTQTAVCLLAGPGTHWKLSSLMVSFVSSSAGYCRPKTLHSRMS